MNLETVIKKLIRFIHTRTDQLSMTVTSGGIDSMEKYQYIIGQINALESVRQELSSLLNSKEKNEGTVIDITTKNTSTK
jgi:hypothetical protein